MTKYIFVTGGVVSGLGKGITAASLGRLLKNRGLKVAADDARLAAAVEQVKPRATSLADVAAGVDYFFREPAEMDAAAAKKFVMSELVTTGLPVAAVWREAISASARATSATFRVAI